MIGEQRAAILGGLVPLALFLATAVRADPTPKPPAGTAIQCMAGPVKRQFGGGDWLVYGCSDGRSLVVVSDTGNPANPFYFVLSPQGGAYRVDGEGNGDRRASDAAGDELQRLTPDQVQTLFTEAEAKSAPAPR